MFSAANAGRYGILAVDFNQPPSDCTDYDVRIDPSSGGNLLICFNGLWGAVCSAGLQQQAAGVLCHQLGRQRQGVNTTCLNCLNYSPFNCQ